MAENGSSTSNVLTLLSRAPSFQQEPQKPKDGLSNSVQPESSKLPPSPVFLSDWKNRNTLARVSRKGENQSNMSSDAEQSAALARVRNVLGLINPILSRTPEGRQPVITLLEKESLQAFVSSANGKTSSKNDIKLEKDLQRAAESILKAAYVLESIPAPEATLKQTPELTMG